MPTFENLHRQQSEALEARVDHRLLAYNKIPSACTIPLPDKTGMFQTAENALLRLMHKNVRNKNQQETEFIYSKLSTSMSRFFTALCCSGVNQL